MGKANSQGQDGIVTLRVASIAGELTKGQRAGLHKVGFKYSFANRCWARRAKQANASSVMARATAVAPVVKF